MPHYVRCPACQQIHPVRDDQLSSDFSCPTPGCGQLLTLNSLHVEQPPNHETDSAIIDELLEQGKKYFSQMNFNEALKVFDQGIQLNPNDINLLEQRVATLIKLGRYQEAINAIDDVINHNLATELRLANMYEYKGQALVGLGKYEGALKYYRKALDSGGNERRIRYGQGSVYIKLKNWQAALDCFTKAQAISQDEVTQYQICNCLCLLKNFSQAEHGFRKMILDGSSDPLVYHGLGCTLVLLKEYKEAIQWLQRFIQAAQSDHLDLVPTANTMIEMAEKEIAKLK